MRTPVVLAVDDIAENIELIAAYLEGVDCEVVPATSGAAAVAHMSAGPADLVLLDLEMPGMNGLEVCRSIKSSVGTRMVPVVMVTAYSAVDDRVRALEAGADDLLAKPVERIELVARVRSLLRAKALYDTLMQTEQVIFSLVRAVEAKDRFTKAHGERVADLAKKLALAAGQDAQAASVTYFAAMVHDIGKIGVPDALLSNPEALSQGDLAVWRRIPVLGAEICEPLKSAQGLQDTIRHHKEKLDGSGYPDGLSGDQISEPARIVAICDAYDALVSGERADRPPMPYERARAVMERLSGTAYDGRLVQLFFEQVAPPPPAPRQSRRRAGVQAGG